MLHPHTRQSSSASRGAVNALIKAAVTIIETDGEAESGVLSSQIVIIDAHTTLRVYGNFGDTTIEVDSDDDIQFLVLEEAPGDFIVDTHRTGDWEETLLAYAEDITASHEPMRGYAGED